MNDSTQRLLTFTLAGEHYGLPLMQVREVIALGAVTSLPLVPQHFLGIMNLRGRIITVIDMRAKLQLPKAEPHPESAVIILDLPDVALGMYVDSVESVLAAEPNMIEPPPATGHFSEKYLAGIARKKEQLVLLLDLQKTFGSDVQVAIGAAAEMSNEAA